MKGLTATPPAQVVRGDRGGRAQAGTRRPLVRRGPTEGFSMIMWIQQLIGGGIHMMMKQTVVLMGQFTPKRSVPSGSAGNCRRSGS